MNFISNPQLGRKKCNRSRRITLLFVLFLSLQLHAVAHTTIQLELNNSTLQNALERIEQKCNYHFVYSSKSIDLNQKISIHETNDLSAILGTLFHNTGIAFTIKENQIILNSDSEALTEDHRVKHTVSGVVKDKEGNSIPGATVVIKGTTLGTITDVDGKYLLKGVTDQQIIQFSFIGMSTIEKKVNGKNRIDIVLASDQKKLDEIVVMGYNTQESAKVTSAVSTLKTEELQNIPISNVSQGLGGRIAGVITTQSSGAPGEDGASIRIRGGGNPLYVIDGFIGGDINSLNPDDIATMTVLKDAASAAVYGARAQDGVIVITTKRGEKDGKLSLSVNANYSMAVPTRLPELMNSYERAQLDNQAAINSGEPPVWSDEQLQKFQDGSDPDLYPNTDLYSMTTRKIAPQYTVNLALSNSLKKTAYRLSFEYLNQGSLYKENNQTYNRYNFRLNTDTYLENIGLKITSDILYTRKEYVKPISSTWTLWSHILGGTPTNPAIYSDGTYSASMSFDNPLWELDEDNGYCKSYNSDLFVRIGGELKIPYIKGLTYKIYGGYKNGYSRSKNWYSYEVPLYSEPGGDPVYKDKPSLNENYSDYTELLLDQHLAYSQKWGKHSLDALLVYSWQKYQSHGVSASRMNYVGHIDELVVGPTDGWTNGGSVSQSGRAGIVGNFSYDYASKYLLTASFRYDGSNNFPKGKRWGFFPSVSIGWRASDEPFFQKWIPERIVNDFKIRGSVGQTGNDGNSYYAYLPTYSIGNGPVFGENPARVPTTGEDGIPSESITWETTNKYNIGFDLGALDNRFTMSFDAFLDMTKDILLNAREDPSTFMGKSWPLQNVGKTRKGGVDLSLSWHDNVGEVNYSIGGNLTYYESLTVYNAEQPNTLGIPWQRNTYSPNYNSACYHATGYYQNTEDLLNNPHVVGENYLQPGNIMYQDYNGDGVIDDYDKQLLGDSGTPRLSFGLTLGADYKGFSTSILLQGASKYNIMMDGYSRGTTQFGMRTVIFKEQMGDFWNPNNPNALYPIMQYESDTNDSYGSDHWIENATYLRLKSLEVGYDFMATLIHSKKVQTLKAYFAGTNLFTIDGIKTPIDPETANTFWVYPIMRSFSFGINVSL